MMARQEMLAAVAQRLGTGAGRWEDRLLGETPGLRRVVACTYRGPLGEPGVEAVAKAYSDASGDRTARVMTTVREALADLRRPPALAVPRAISYDAELRLLVQEAAAGRPYLELAAGRDHRDHLRAAGAAIGTLHGLHIPLGRGRTLEDNMAELMRPHPFVLAERVPEVATRVEAIVEALRIWEDAARSDVVPAPAHRDLHLRQLLRDGDRVWLLDWDLAAAADPALDLGNLTATMTTKLPPARAAACAAAVLEGYAPHDRCGAIGRRRAYEAFTFLRLACKRFRLAAPAWRDDVGDLLARAEDALEA